MKLDRLIHSLLVVLFVGVIPSIAFAQEDYEVVQDTTTGKYHISFPDDDVEEAEYVIRPNEGLPTVSDSKVITSVEWKEITNDKTYKYEKKKEKKTKKQDTLFEMTQFGALVMQLVFYGGLALLLVLIGWFVFKYINRKKDNFEKQLLTSEDKLFASKEEELQMQLQENLNNANYNESIRYRFGVVLKKLEAEKIITWKPGATNDNYLKDLPHYAQPKFKDLVQLFNKACYSGLEINEGEYNLFERYASTFEDLLTSKDKQQ